MSGSSISFTFYIFCKQKQRNLYIKTIHSDLTIEAGTSTRKNLIMNIFRFV